MKLQIAPFLLLLVSFFKLAGPCPAASIHDNSEVERVILYANDKFMHSEFDAGIYAIRELEKKIPEDPALSYFAAHGYWWKIVQAHLLEPGIEETPFDDAFDYYLLRTIDLCEAGLKRDKNDSRALFYMGNAYSLRSRLKAVEGSFFSAGRDAAKGKKYLEEILKQEPSQPDALYNLGIYNYLAGILPKYAKLLKLLLFLPGGDKEKGMSYLKIAGEKSTYFSAEARLILARFYADFEDQPGEALRIVHDFRNQYPDNAWFHFWEATILSDELNEYEKAEAIYQTILENCNKNKRGYTQVLKNQAWLKLARAQSRLLYPDKAVEELRKLISTNPQKPFWTLPKAYLEMGNIYDSIGMRSEALQAYNKVLTFPDYRHSHEQARDLKERKYNATNSEIYRLNLDGRRLVAAGRYEEAQKSFDSVLQKYPDNDQTLFAIADMSLSKGELDNAEKLFQKVLNRKPAEPKWIIPGIYVRLGQIYEAKNQQEEARKSYEKALDIEFLASDDRNRARQALKEISIRSGT